MLERGRERASSGEDHLLAGTARPRPDLCDGLISSRRVREGDDVQAQFDRDALLESGAETRSRVLMGLKGDSGDAQSIRVS